MSSPSNEFNSSQNTTERNLKSSIKTVLNFPYIKTIHFMLKILIIIFHICGSISVSIKYDNWGSTRYYNFVAITGIFLVLLIIFAHFFYLTKRFQKIPWKIIELVFDILWAILILIAAAIVTDNAKRYANMESYAAGAFFGFGAFLIFSIDGILRLISIIRG